MNWLCYTIIDVYKYLHRGLRTRISDLTLARLGTCAHFIGNEHPRSGENGRVATSVPLITDNSRKARGAREGEKESDDDNVGVAERVRKGAGMRGGEERSTRGPGVEKKQRCGRVVSMGPIEKPFSYSKQQRPAGALPPRRIRFPGNHLLLLEAIARHNGQVIHPLRLLARETTTAPGRHSSSPSPSLRFRVVRCLGEKREREEGRGWGERGDWRYTRAHNSCANYFSSSFVTLRVTRDCYRPFP